MLTVRSLRTLSTASSLAQMKTSRGRSSRAELCSSFSTYGKMPTDSAYKVHVRETKCVSETNTYTHTFNGPFSGTTRVSRYEKSKTNLDFTEARDSEWQWHQGHM